MKPSSPSSSARNQGAWLSTVQGHIEANAAAMLLAATATAVLLIVSFIGVLQAAVDRGEMRMQQQRLAATPAAHSSPVIVARAGR